MGSRVELFERIRRDREFEGLSTHALARRYGVHRRTVRQALGSAVPPGRKRPEGRSAPALGAFRGLIDSWLLADRDAPRKQRHTAKRIYGRLVAEHGAVVAETTVRDYVRRRRRELGLAAEAFCPQVLAAPAADTPPSPRRSSKRPRASRRRPAAASGPGQEPRAPRGTGNDRRTR